MIYKNKARPRRHFPFILGSVILSGFLLALVGCGPGIPKDLKNKAKAIPDTIKSTASRVEELQGKYETLRKSPGYAAVKRFEAKENWMQKFQLASEELTRATSVYEKDLTPLIKQNKPELVPKVKVEIGRINKIIRNAKNTAHYPSTRFLNIRNTIENVEDLQSMAIKNADKIEQQYAVLKKGPLAKALKQFPDQTQKINARFAPILDLERKSRDHLAVVLGETKKHKAKKETDYAAFTDSKDGLLTGVATSKTLAAKFTGDVDQLYTSYTKVLLDMKEDYFVIIMREAWDENSDYYNPHTVTFKRRVSPETYEALTDESLDSVAEIKSGFTGSKFINRVGNMWKELSINPAEKWPRGNYNAASFWVEDSDDIYYHKYMLETGGETKETDWVKVDYEFYEAHLEHLGMAILAKPYGLFEQDRSIQAAPPGMAYVGNSEYGEWKKGDDGNRFWSWYGKYALFSNLLFFPPYYYSYHSWNRWNNNYRYKKPYFGKNMKGTQKFGTHGSILKKSPKFQSTTFGKSGGFKARTASVRGAGAGLRGGGPKGKGK